MVSEPLVLRHFNLYTVHVEQLCELCRCNKGVMGSVLEYPNVETNLANDAGGINFR